MANLPAERSPAFRVSETRESRALADRARFSFGAKVGLPQRFASENRHFGPPNVSRFP